MSDKIKIASVTSEPQPQKGQKHRSSGDFSTDGVPNGYSKLYWEVSGVPVPKGISFDVNKDKTGTDPVIFRNLTDGSVTGVFEDRQLYIANPRGANTSFLVTVYATN